MDPQDNVKMQRAITSFVRNPRPLRLQCAEMAYEWGDESFVANLLGKGTPQRVAELWMGAHSAGPSRATMDGVEVPLDRLISTFPDETLGRCVGEKFNQLPYLFKVLSAAKPLSIQAHPSKQQAEVGFALENAAGKPLKDPTRNYKDDNHKPELICALTDFYALRGFRPLDQITWTLREHPLLSSILPGFAGTNDDLKHLYTRMMRMPQQEVDAVLGPLLGQLQAQDARQPFRKDQREYWMLTADREFCKANKDRGLFSIYLLNLVHLRPGDAMYLPAGELHAYLEGAGMEIMANSDNVLRGGLTPKHVDVDELLKTLTFTAGTPEILAPQPGSQPGERVYITPAREFELRCIQLEGSRIFTAEPHHSAEILVVTQGEGVMEAGEMRERMPRGSVMFVALDTRYRLHTPDGVTIYKASVPTLR